VSTYLPLLVSTTGIAAILWNKGQDPVTPFTTRQYIAGWNWGHRNFWSQIGVCVQRAGSRFGDDPGGSATRRERCARAVHASEWLNCRHVASWRRAVLDGSRRRNYPPLPAECFMAIAWDQSH